MDQWFLIFFLRFSSFPVQFTRFTFQNTLAAEIDFVLLWRVKDLFRCNFLTVIDLVPALVDKDFFMKINYDL